MIHRRMRVYGFVSLFCLLSGIVVSAQSKPEILKTDQVKKLVPTTFFFAGQSSPVQVRNTSGVKVGDHFVLAGLVDNSGYSSEVKAKYQGFLITEVGLNIDGKDLAPGEYGFGFSNGKFIVMDVGNHDLLATSEQTDEKLSRPVPLKITEEDGACRLYAGRHWVELKVQ